MKSIFTKSLVSVFFCFASITLVYGQLYEWRGPDRSGVYNESELMKKWPDGGPALLWEVNNMGDGYSSPTVTEDAIYITGRKDSSDVLMALSLDGKLKWELIYGKAWITNHKGTRCTPTYYNGNIFLISGSGDIVCVGLDGRIKWSKNYYSLYESKPHMWGISESPLVIDDLVIASPGGKKASLVAFNINDGSVVWTTEPMDQTTQFVNPKLIEYAGKKMIITIMEKDIIAVNAKDGNIIWKVPYSSNNTTGGRAMRNHAITPIFRDGHILIANGYNFVALKLKLSPDGNSVDIVWENKNFDPQHGGVVLIGNYIYGATHQSSPSDTWTCVDWTTGNTLWTTKWHSRGSIISADGMLYIFEEKSGNVALVNPDNTKLDIVSEFKVTQGEGPFWAHPVISNGKLYIRHGGSLMVYKIN